MHSLILGATESGKSTLAKGLCKEFQDRGREVLVLDPLGTDWGTDQVFTDPELFLPYFWQVKGRAVFIDESGDAVGRVNAEMIRTGTKGRHNLHQVFFITQSRSQLSPILRRQCAQLFCFAIGPDEAEYLAEEWICPALLEAPKLPQGEFLWVRRFWQGQAGGVKRLSAFSKKPLQ